MSTTELREWLELLANSNKTRERIVYDLLQHANEDGMTLEDRTICKRALEMIAVGLVKERAERAPRIPKPLSEDSDMELA